MGSSALGGASCFHLFHESSSIVPLSSCIVLVPLPFHLGSRCASYFFFYVFLMCAVCCDCDACVLHSLANSNWCSVVRKLRYSWRLFAWGILGHDNKRGVGVHASHLHFPKIDRLRLLQCNPYCQECLLEVHALAWENMSDGACGDRIKLITIGNHGIPDTFYLQIPKRAHFL